METILIPLKQKRLERDKKIRTLYKAGYSMNELVIMTGHSKHTIFWAIHHDVQRGVSISNNYPLKQKAHQLLNQAIKSGKIKRSNCEVCGEGRKYQVQAHHNDYLKPLEVQWLCVKHHKAVHKTNNH